MREPIEDAEMIGAVCLSDALRSLTYAEAYAEHHAPLSHDQAVSYGSDAALCAGREDFWVFATAGGWGWTFFLDVAMSLSNEYERVAA